MSNRAKRTKSWLSILLLVIAAPAFAQDGNVPSGSSPAAEAKTSAVGDAESKKTAAEESSDATSTEETSAPQQHVILVVGAVGSEEFSEPFQEWAERWRQAAELGDVACTIIGLEPNDTPDRERLEEALKRAQKKTTEPLWLVMIGHGTFNGRAAKFNLRGRDVSATELRDWLAVAARPLVLVNCASSSGPFINRLSGPDRVIVTSTKSGYEMNFARFGGELSAAILSGAADLDKDGQTSILEAFLTASNRVEEFYEQEGRLATEHALLDDNADKLGTPARFFQGVRAVKTAKAGAAVDGRRAQQIILNRSARERSLTSEQRAERDRLERRIAELRDRKSQLAEETYYAELEQLLVELSGVLLAAESPTSNATPDASEPARSEPARSEPADAASKPAASKPAAETNAKREAAEAKRGR